MKGLVLIIDDNVMDIKIATSSIEREGYACFGFTDYRDALVWVASNTPQIIFLDLLMPSITGYELIPILKKQPNVAQTPIIIMSGKNQSEDVAKAIKLGASDYIVKPLDPLVIQQKLVKTGPGIESDFYAVEIGGAGGLPVVMTKALHLESFSEFGVNLRTAAKVNLGEVIELASLPLDVFGKPQLLVRCLNCVKDDEKENFVVQCTYIGLTEAQRQVIRTNCRRLSIQRKKGVAS